MKKCLLTLILLLSAMMAISADNVNGDKNAQSINLSQTQIPLPTRLVDDPVAEYNTVTGTLTITLDATYYSDYTITISSDYASMDYYVTSPVTVFPASALSEVTYIYIDSDDSGAYEGVLDLSDINNTY